MNALSPLTTNHPGVQAGLILLASAVVGLAYNALNPVGLRLSARPQLEQSQARPLAEPAASLYHVETVSARLIAAKEPTATLVSTNVPLKGVSTAATAVRTTWEKAQRLVNRGEVVLVDSRSRVTYEAGHIPGAVSLPLKQVDSEISDFLVNHLPPDARLVVYCANAKCASSAKLSQILTKTYGYDEVQYVPGGYLEWLQFQNAKPAL